MSRKAMRPPVRVLSNRHPRPSRRDRGFAPATESLEGRTLMTVTLLKDINALDLYPAQITDVGGTAYFVTHDANAGYSVMRSDGTAAGTVVVKSYPLAGTDGYGAIPQNLANVGGALFFTVTPPHQSGAILEKVDPASGIVTDVAPIGASPFGLTDSGGKALFVTIGTNSNRTLVGSDGTSGGTVVLKDNIPYSISDNSTAKVGGNLVFVAPDGTGNPAIWATDGTVAGTALAASLPTLAAGSVVNGLTSLGSAAIFRIVAQNGTSDLWVTDGTPAGTKNIAPGMSIQGATVAAGGKAYFWGSQGASYGLFATDGTAAGTTFLKPYSSGGTFSQFDNLTAAGSKLFFTTKDSTATNWVLWSTDGTVAGTTPAATIVLGPDVNADIPYIRLPHLVGVGTGVFFSGYDAANGLELWHSDGTQAGTAIVKDINPGADGSDPTGLAAVGGRVAFAAHDGKAGNELWFSDGTASGTTLGAALPAPHDFGSYVPPNGANANDLNPSPSAVTIGPLTYFLARDADHGQELWRTDGTTAGTLLVKDINPGPADSGIVSLTDVNGKLLFFAADGVNGDGIQLWTSDGSPAGTTPVSSSIAARGTIGVHMAVMGNSAYYFAAGSFGQAIWKTDGNDAGTVHVADVPNSYGFPIGNDLTVAGSRLFFTTTDPTNGKELWSSDGTQAGTQLVKDVNPGVASSSPMELTAVGSTLYFTADDGTHGRELWQTNGTAAGTLLVKDINTGSPASSPSSLTAVGTRLYFLADGGIAGTGLWTTDGTDAGTILLKDYGAGAYLGGTGFLTAKGNNLVFAIRDGLGRGLYSSDGTVSGTQLLSSPPGFVVGPLTNLSGTVYFPVFNLDSDAQGFPTLNAGDFLYSSDGTAAGTKEVSRIGPATNTDELLQAVRMMPSGDVLTFGNDGFHGVEPLLVNSSAGPNHPPILNASPPQSLVLGQTVQVQITATDPDPGQSVRFSLGAGAPTGAAIDPATGLFTWTPSLAEGAGTYTVPIVATDNGTPPDSANGTLTVVVAANRVPILDAIPDQSIAQGALLAFMAHATDADAGQTLTFTLDPGAPTGAVIDPTTGAFAWTPTAAQGPGTFTLMVRATDNGLPALSATRPVKIVVTLANRPPVLAAIPDQMIPQAATLTFTASATDPDAGQTLTYSLDAGAPIGAAIDPMTGVFAWTPTTAQGPGTFTITVRATDDGVPALSASQAVKIVVTPANRRPVIAAIPDQTIPQMATLSLTAMATDPDPGQTLTFSLDAGAPTGAAIDPHTGIFSWTPTAAQAAGAYPITVRATDNGLPSLSASRAFTVAVTQANRPPTLAAIADQTINEGQTATLAAIGGDPDPGQFWRYSLDPGAPAWASIDPVLGRITLRPTDGPSQATITVRVTDSGNPALSTPRSFRVNIANVPPTVILPSGDAAVVAGDTLARQGSFTDPGTDAWAATVDYGDASGAVPLALAADKSFHLSHAYTSAGTYTVNVAVTDKDGGVGTASFRAVVSAGPPFPPPAVPSAIYFDESSYTVDEAAGVARINLVLVPGTPDPTGQVTIVTEDGTAVAGVDYTRTLAVITLAPGETTKTITVPILDAGLSSGEKTLRLVLSDLSTNIRVDGPSAATLVIRDNDPFVAPVTVGPVQVQTKRGRVADVLVHLSGAVDRSEAESLANYHLVSLVRNRRGVVTTKTIPLASASYDASANTITLRPSGRVAPHGSARLTIVATGIHDRFHRPIQAGVDFVTNLHVTQISARSVGLPARAIDAVLAALGRRSRRR